MYTSLLSIVDSGSAIINANATRRPLIRPVSAEPGLSRRQGNRAGRMATVVKATMTQFGDFVCDAANVRRVTTQFKRTAASDITRHCHCQCVVLSVVVYNNAVCLSCRLLGYNSRPTSKRCAKNSWKWQHISCFITSPDCRWIRAGCEWV